MENEKATVMDVSAVEVIARALAKRGIEGALRHNAIADGYELFYETADGRRAYTYQPDRAIPNGNLHGLIDGIVDCLARQLKESE